MQFVTSKLKRFDFHRKTVSEVNDRTLSGAIITIVTIVAVAVLLYSNISEYFSTDMVNHMTLDSTIGYEDVQLKFEVVFSNIPCGGNTSD